MDRRDVFFFAVPLGLKVNPQNLHGLAALTGGAVVRVQEDLNNVDRRKEFVEPADDRARRAGREGR